MGFNNSTHTIDVDIHGLPFIVLGINLGLLICAVSILTIFVLLKCTKLTRQIRLMVIHMTAINLAFGILFLSARSYEFITGSRCGVIDRTTNLPFVLFNIFQTVTGLDRVLSLVYSIKYTLWTKKRNAFVVIGLLYVLGIVVYIPQIPQNVQFSCGDDGLLFTLTGLWIFVCSNCVLVVGDVVIYLYIGVLVIKAKSSSHPMGRNDYRRFSLATFKTFILCLVTIVLMGPSLISFAIKLSDNTAKTPMIVHALVMLHQIVSPVLILTSYKECRFHLAVLCLCCCKGKKETIERDYKQHYATFAITPTCTPSCTSKLWNWNLKYCLQVFIIEPIK